jgi:hypothetical protein
MKLNYTTGALTKSAATVEPDDLFLTPDSRLVVGSRNSQPVFLDTNLNPLGSFGTGGGNRLFVTEIVSQATPEPSSLALFGLGLAGAACAVRRRRADRA